MQTVEQFGLASQALTALYDIRQAIRANAEGYKRMIDAGGKEPDVLAIALSAAVQQRQRLERINLNDPDLAAGVAAAGVTDADEWKAELMTALAAFKASGKPVAERCDALLASVRQPKRLW